MLLEKEIRRGFGEDLEKIWRRLGNENRIARNRKSKERLFYQRNASKDLFVRRATVNIGRLAACFFNLEGTAYAEA
jgi:hypothetical protein